MADFADALSELEGCVIGLIAGRGEATAYAVRRELASSLSPFWTASAGSVYPLLRRLEGRGLLASETRRFGTRIRCAYTATDVGRRALADWLGPPANENRLLAEFSGLRLRAHFLILLPASKRQVFLHQAAVALRARRSVICRTRRQLMAAGEMWDRLLHDDAIAVIDARLRWLRRAQRWLQSHEPELAWRSGGKSLASRPPRGRGG